MNINAPGIGMPILRFLTIKPQDSGNNRIPSWSIRWKHLTSWNSRLEDSAETAPVTDFLANDETS